MEPYLYKTKPFAHQRECLNTSWKREGFALFLETGTGKSKIVVDNLALLWREKMIDAALIFSLKGAYRQWHSEHIPEHMPEWVKRLVVYWTPGGNLKERVALDRVMDRGNTDTLKILVMNIEALSTDKGRDFATAFMKDRRVFIAVDESTTIKNRKARKSKAAVALGGMASYRRILSGYPTTKCPLDLFNQCAFLGEKYLGFRSYYSMMYRYGVVKDKVFGGRVEDTFDPETGQIEREVVGRKVKVVVAYKNLEELTEKLKKFSYRKLKRDCFDLPPQTWEFRDVEMTKEQRKAYDAMRDQAYILLGEREVSATIALTQIEKLHQITCGFLTTDDKQVIPLPNNRMDVLLDELETLEGKVIIWAGYRYNIQEIERALAKKYGPRSVASYYGDTDARRRPEIVHAFQDPCSGLDWLVANPATAGFGLTLTRSHLAIYYSNSYNLEHRIQSEDRINRYGQTSAMTYIDLRCPGTVDDKYVECLVKKMDISNTVMGDGWKEWLRKPD